MHPALYHMLMVGWATQLIWGVAIWLFPIYSREQPRGNERQLWLGYAALNTGLVLRCVCEPLLNLFPNWTFPGWPIRVGLMLSALLMIAAIWLVGLNLWPRIKPMGGR